MKEISWYQRNKASHIKNTSERRNRIRIENRLYIKTIKESSPCADCGKQYPHYVMDFDHISGTKIKSVSEMMAFSLKNLKLEIAKCQVVCANCHRERTYGGRSTEGFSSPKRMIRVRIPAAMPN